MFTKYTVFPSFYHLNYKFLDNCSMPNVCPMGYITIGLFLIVTHFFSIFLLSLSIKLIEAFPPPYTELPYSSR